MFAKLFAGPLAFVYWIFGVWGFILSMQVLYDLGGIFTVVVGLVIAPVSYLLAPFYAGLANGYWLPAVVSFAPVVVIILLSTVVAVLNK